MAQQTQTQQTQQEPQKSIRRQREDEIAGMSVRTLKAECQKEGLRWQEPKEQMAKRLLLRRYGSRKKYVPGLTICRVCGEEVRVIGRTTTEIDGGKLLVTRQIKCLGKHCHTYPLKEIIDRNAPPQADANE